MDREEVAAGGFRHPRATGKKRLRGRVGTDAYHYTFMHRPMAAELFPRHVLVQTLIDCARHMLQRNFTKCNQVSAPEEVRKGALGAIHRVDIARRSLV